MESLNFVNLIQSATAAVGGMGGFLLWRTHEFKGIAMLLWLTAFASLINILEESGISRDFYLISPIFIMLFGPAMYLAARFLIDKTIKSSAWLHLAPVIILLFYTEYVQTVIAIGTLWRLVYAFMTVKALLAYKKVLDDERSDSDEYSLAWFVYLVAFSSAFTLVDLIRLNSQPQISYELNVFGQGVYNFIWLIAVMIITLMLTSQKGFPNSAEKQNQKTPSSRNSRASGDNEYQALFSELDSLVKTHQWYLTPRITLANISELTGLQSRDISRAINLNTDKSFNDYVNAYRVEYVCQLIEQTPAKSLLEIAEDSGFSSKASFNKVFKHLKGITPSQFKAQINV